MVNIVTICKPVLKVAMRLAGMSPRLVHIDTNTVMNFWGPTKPSSTKPTILLLHGFIANAILTWQFQVWSLKSHYNVYAPDFLFFGDSFTDSDRRTINFQAHCVASGLKQLGVYKCVVVGFSYGGMVGFELAEMYAELVESLVVNGSVVKMTESMSVECLMRTGRDSWEDFLLPESMEDLKVTLGIGSHKFPWLPNFFYQDFLEVEFEHRKERAELLKAMVTGNEFSVPNIPQRIHLLWGENDKIFNIAVAESLLRRLGLDDTKIQLVEKAGHVALIERPWNYNRHLRSILESLKITEGTNLDIVPPYQKTVQGSIKDVDIA